MKNRIDNKQLIASVVLLERFVRDIYPAKHSSAVQPLQWSILRYISRMPAERCEVRWIAQYLGITRAPVTRAIATLEARNLVCQSTSGVDARTNTVTLTDLGLATLADDPILSAADRIRGLSEVEQAQFIKSIRSLALGFESNDHEAI
jgi:DNA-binding MarR family transcriptional regulator